MRGGLKTQAACDASVEAEFRAAMSPLIEKMKRQFKAEDDALLRLHPGHPDNQPTPSHMEKLS